MVLCWMEWWCCVGWNDCVMLDGNLNDGDVLDGMMV